MLITTTPNGFFYLAHCGAGEVPYLKNSLWSQHGSAVYCKMHKNGGKDCVACQHKIPAMGWYASTQLSGDPRHPVEAFKAFLDPAAQAVYQTHSRTSTNSHASVASGGMLVPAPDGRVYLPFQLAGIEFALQRQHTLIADEPGLGKAQPLTAKILTPTGWTTMGEVKVGDVVLGSCRNPCKVTGVFPQGVKEIFRANFGGPDGLVTASVECCEDHLWKCWLPNEVEANRDRVLSLGDIREHLESSGASIFVPRVSHKQPDRWTVPGPWKLGQAAPLLVLSVVPVGRAEAQCISVDAPDHLYVTDDFVLTHNTIQAIGFANAMAAGTVLIVCPASLRRNWERELARWLVDADRTKVYVVSYDQARREQAQLVNVRWDLLVLDEAHYLKNDKAARTKAVFGSSEFVRPFIDHRLPGGRGGGRTSTAGIFGSATRVLALTGTPIANRPKDIWTIVHALAPQVFPKYIDFAQRYCDATSKVVYRKGVDGKKPEARKVWSFSGQSNLAELGQKLRGSIMIRREKMSVLTDLPEKRRQILPLDLKSAKAQKSFDARVGKVIGEQLKSAEGRGDFRAFGEMIQQAIPFAEMSKMRKAVGLEKLPAVMAFLDDRLGLDRDSSRFESDEKLVVFAHHREVLETIKAAYGKHCVLFWGGMSDNQRAKAVDAFQTDPDVRVFAGQIQASGTGLTLTASSTVVFAELDWVPSNLLQCEDRIHRIGQKNAALAIYLVVEGSLEARMAYLLAEKDEIIREALR